MMFSPPIQYLLPVDHHLAAAARKRPQDTHWLVAHTTNVDGQPKMERRPLRQLFSLYRVGAG